jgi:excisionase family DNA binding protein
MPIHRVFEHAAAHLVQHGKIGALAGLIIGFNVVPGNGGLNCEGTTGSAVRSCEEMGEGVGLVLVLLCGLIGAGAIALGHYVWREMKQSNAQAAPVPDAPPAGVAPPAGPQDRLTSKREVETPRWSGLTPTAQSELTALRPPVVAPPSVSHPNRELTAEQAAKYIGLDLPRTRRALASGQLEGRKVSGRWRVRQQVLDDWIEEQKAYQARWLQQRQHLYDDWNREGA